MTIGNPGNHLASSLGKIGNGKKVKKNSGDTTKLQNVIRALTDPSITPQKLGEKHNELKTLSDNFSWKKPQQQLIKDFLLMYEPKYQEQIKPLNKPEEFNANKDYNLVGLTISSVNPNLSANGKKEIKDKIAKLKQDVSSQELLKNTKDYIGEPEQLKEPKSDSLVKPNVRERPSIRKFDDTSGYDYDSDGDTSGSDSSVRFRNFRHLNSTKGGFNFPKSLSFFPNGDTDGFNSDCDSDSDSDSGDYLSQLEVSPFVKGGLGGGGSRGPRLFSNVDTPGFGPLVSRFHQYSGFAGGGVNSALSNSSRGLSYFSNGYTAGLNSDFDNNDLFSTDYDAGQFFSEDEQPKYLKVEAESSSPISSDGHTSVDEGGDNTKLKGGQRKGGSNNANGLKIGGGAAQHAIPLSLEQITHKPKTDSEKAKYKQEILTEFQSQFGISSEDFKEMFSESIRFFEPVINLSDGTSLSAVIDGIYDKGFTDFNYYSVDSVLYDDIKFKDCKLDQKYDLFSVVTAIKSDGNDKNKSLRFFIISKFTDKLIDFVSEKIKNVRKTIGDTDGYFLKSNDVGNHFEVERLNKGITNTVSIPDDGSCLFRSLLYIKKAREV